MPVFLRLEGTFAEEVLRKRFHGRGFAEEVSEEEAPRKVPRKRFPGRGFAEEVSDEEVPRKVLRKRLRGIGFVEEARKRFPGKEVLYPSSSSLKMYSIIS